MDLFEKLRPCELAAEAMEKGIYPYFHALETRQDIQVVMEGKRRIMLGSNNYLGLTTNEAVVKAGMHAYETLGSGCSGSRCPGFGRRLCQTSRRGQISDGRRCLPLQRSEFP